VRKHNYFCAIYFTCHAIWFFTSHSATGNSDFTFLHKMDFCDDQAGIEIHKEMFMTPISVSDFFCKFQHSLLQSVQTASGANSTSRPAGTGGSVPEVQWQGPTSHNLQLHRRMQKHRTSAPLSNAHCSTLCAKGVQQLTCSVQLEYPKSYKDSQECAK